MPNGEYVSVSTSSRWPLGASARTWRILVVRPGPLGARNTSGMRTAGWPSPRAGRPAGVVRGHLRRADEARGVAHAVQRLREAAVYAVLQGTARGRNAVVADTVRTQAGARAGSASAAWLQTTLGMMQGYYTRAVPRQLVLNVDRCAPCCPRSRSSRRRCRSVGMTKDPSCADF